MASNHHRYHPEGKVSAGAPPKLAKAGSAPMMAEKAGPFAGCPGKCQPKNRSLGVKKVQVYAKSDGL